MKVNRFRFLSTVDTRLLAVLLLAVLLFLPTLSMGGVQNVTHAPQNRLIGCTSPTTEATYAYDALDRRIAKTVDGVTEAWVHDSWGLLSTTSADVVMDFEGGQLVRRWQHGPGTDEPLGLFTVSGTGGSAYELHADRLGSILRVVEAATGTVAAEYDYQTFGLRTATGALSQRYAFTGREADDESGLLYYRARHFDPATGMFLQRDPIGFAGGDLNLYAYTWNDPLNWTDPSGNSAVECYQGSRTGGACGSLLGAVGRGGLFGAIGYLAGSLINDILFATSNGEGSGPDEGQEDSQSDGPSSGGEDPDPRDKIKEIIKKLPEKCLVTFACKQFADKLREALEEEGIDYEVLDIHNDLTDFIFSDQHGVVGETGFHTGTEVGGNVFDNLYPDGIPTDDWLNDFGYDYPGMRVERY